VASDAGELDMEADCSMVQAFENPTENPNKRPGSSQKRARNRHSISDRWTGQGRKYGSTLRLPQARRLATSTSSAAGFEPFGDPAKVNQFCRI
jgi:hypothetical protein